MRITIEEIEELNDWMNSFESDDEYWEMQPQYKIEGFSDYIVYPKQGLIWSCKRNKWVGAKDNKTGYWHCALTSDDGREWKTQVHRVIWTAVNGTIPQGYEINHIDEDKSNNSISNLNLMTRKENINWGTHNERVSKAKKGKTFSKEHKEKLSKAKKGKKQHNISKAMTNGITSKAVGAYKNGQLIMVFPSTNEAGRNGYNQGAVGACCRNCFNREGNNSYKGYQWRYI